MSYDAMAKEVSSLTYEEQVNLMEILMESIKKALLKRNETSAKKTDFTDSYPKGYFDLFGSINDPTFCEPEEVPLELDKMENFDVLS